MAAGTTDDSRDQPTLVGAENGWLYRFGSIGDRSTDTPPERLRHRLLIYMGLLMAGGAVMWSGISFAFGFRFGAWIPIGYIVLTALNFAAFAATKRFELASRVQVFASVLLPFVFQWSIGGAAASGAAMLWALIAVIGSLTFSDARAMGRWLAVYLVLVVASGVIDGTVRARFAMRLSEGITATFLVANIAMISAVVCALIYYFLAQREQAMSALARANAAIEGLRKEVADAKQLGQYTLVGKLGAGGMGTVYRAKHAMLRRPTAIKLVRADMADESTLVRFEREVQLTATLNHPNVVTVYDYGRTPEGTFYYVMELLDGADLGVVVRRSGRFSASRAVHVLTQIAEALGEAHRSGLIHRDVKPANVLLTSRPAPDFVKVLDFGLVKDVSTQDTSQSMVGQGGITGTPAYMSPEAIARPNEVDARSDVYSLGCLAYYLLSGFEVFEGENAMDLCSDHLRTPPTPPSTRAGIELPRPLEELVMRCLAKRPSERPDTEGVLEALRACAAEPWGRWNRATAATWWEENGPSLVREGDDESMSAPKTVVARVAASASSGEAVVKAPRDDSGTERIDARVRTTAHAPNHPSEDGEAERAG